MSKKSSGNMGSHGGQRDLTVRVYSARKRSNASTRWLERQLNDPYVIQAKRDGYRSRAAYKIIELDDKYGFFKPHSRVLDLGAAPGGWTQVAIDRIKSTPEDIRVLGVDILEMSPIAGSTIMQLDFNDDDAPAKIQHALGGKVDVVMSDIAPNTIGHAPTDHLRIMHMCELAYDFALQVLAEGGTFLCKVRQGGTEAHLLADMRQRFDKVSHAKPQSSRKDSAEAYVVAQGFHIAAE
jgi:23S rRNA (uridine2552-2'-O)-methyltransferase